MQRPHRFPVICGPTASGKSALAVEVAMLVRERLGLEPRIITADAFQVYRGMDIGTAKPTAQERRGIPHELIDLVEPTEKFTVEQWLTAADALLPHHPPPPGAGEGGGFFPIVVGGTHLYIKALMEGLFEGPGADAALREQLSAMDPAARREELQRVDPDAAARIHPNDLRRTIRALEVFRLTGKPISAHQQQWDQSRPRPGALLVCLNWPTEELNPRINARVKAMLDAGLLEEVRALHAAGPLGPQAREALGYKQLLAHLEDPRRVKLEDAVEQIKIETRRFGKNQRTWLRRLSTLPGAMPLSPSGADAGALAGAIWDRIIQI